MAVIRELKPRAAGEHRRRTPRRNPAAAFARVSPQRPAPREPEVPDRTGGWVTIQPSGRR